MTDNHEDIARVYDIYQYLWEISSAFIANICRDEDEWLLWGSRLCKRISEHYCLFYDVPGDLNSDIDMNESSFSANEVPSMSKRSLDDICEQFRTLIGRGSSILVLVHVSVKKSNDILSSDIKDLSQADSLNSCSFEDDMEYIIVQDIKSFLKSRVKLILKAIKETISCYQHQSNLNHESELATDILSSDKDPKALFESTFHEIVLAYLEVVLYLTGQMQKYDARMRVVVKQIMQLFKIPIRKLNELEIKCFDDSMAKTSERLTGSSGNIIAPDTADQTTDTKAISTVKLGLKRSILRRVWFNEIRNLPRIRGILPTYRWLQVITTATGGGLLVAISSQLAMTSAMSSLLVLLSTAVGPATAVITSAAVSTTLAINAAAKLVHVAGGVYTILAGSTAAVMQVASSGFTISQVVGLTAATMAGYKMINRTAPLKDFYLEQLYPVPVIHIKNDDLLVSKQGWSDISLNVNSNTDNDNLSIEKPSDQPLSVTSEDKPSQMDPDATITELVSYDSEKAEEAVAAAAKDSPETEMQLLSEDDNLEERATIEEKLFDTDTPQSKALNHVPVHILVCGHAEKDVDIKAVWGFDDTEVHDLSKSSKPTESNDSKDGDATDDHSKIIPKDWQRGLGDGAAYLLTWVDKSDLEAFSESYTDMAKGQVIGKIKGAIKDMILAQLPIPSLSLPLTVMDRVADCDNPWVVAMDRARQAGALLAQLLLAQRAFSKNVLWEDDIDETIINEAEGKAAISQKLNSSETKTISTATASTYDTIETTINDDEQFEGVKYELLANSSVNLIGYGMGAAVVFYCLTGLANQGGYAARGIVENAILIGAPVESTQNLWDDIRRIVSGRVVNVYSERDYILAIMARLKNWTLNVAGLQPIQSDVLYAIDTLDGNSEGNKDASSANSPDESNDGVTFIDQSIDEDSEAIEKEVVMNLENDMIQDIIMTSRTIENINVSDMIISQREYPNHLHEILDLVYKNAPDKTKYGPKIIQQCDLPDPKNDNSSACQQPIDSSA